MILRTGLRVVRPHPSRPRKDPGSRFASVPELPLRLTVIMPVYNEHDTVAQSVERVLTLEIPDVAIELVIVESNSTDGSREFVSAYAENPRVLLILEDVPLGKGHAVRTGLLKASGDIILIQDADLEYSVDDYPVLLEPILEGRADFTLGSRHIRGQAMRAMPKSRAVGWVVNAAHWWFTALFDLVYGVRLRDPFTMYKVFRHECVTDVKFVSDRFDFDWELVAKLIRLGFKPLEVPVFYEARSFASGKKVRFFRDPPTWVAACFRFRFSRIRTGAPEPALRPAGQVTRRLPEPGLIQAEDPPDE